MSVQTRGQKLANKAYDRVAKHTDNGQNNLDEKYVSFAKKFPALIHTCGLAQAVAFAQAKGKSMDDNKPKKPEILYLEDLAAVLNASGHNEINSASTLADRTRTAPLSTYLCLSRDALNAAGWLKRYTEAAGEDD